MKKSSLKFVALMLSAAMLFSMAGCSSLEDIFGMDHSGSKKDKKERDEDEDDDEDNLWNRGGTDESETETETGPDETDASSSETSGNGGYQIDPSLTYPDHIATYDEIHPAFTPGNVSGQDASDLLDEIEHDVLQEYLGRSYVDVELLFDDPSSIGITVEDVSWGEVSADVTQEDIDFTQDVLDRLYTIDPDSLDDQDRIFYDKILYDFEEQAYSLQFTAFNYYTSVFNALTGPQCDLFFLLEVMSFDTVEDAENYITLLIDIDRYYDEICAFEEEKANLGFALSDDNYEAIAESFDNLAAQEDDCFLFDSFQTRLDNIQGLSDADRTRLIEEHDAAMHDYVFPEFVECAERMRALKGSGGTDVGLCEYPSGDALFAIIFRSKTNSSRTVEESIASLDAMLEELISNYYSDMYAAQGNWYDEYTNHVYSMGDTQENLTYLETAVATDFPQLPEHSYTLMNVPEVFEDNFSPAAFLGFHLDDLDSNLIITNQSSVDNNFGITCAHEGYPGHMFESVYHRANCEHPYMYIFDSTGYSEGWAVYVENYSFRYFADISDPVTDLIAIDNQLNLLLMTRVDIGINYEGWDVQDACDYCDELFGMSGMISEDGMTEMYQRLTLDPCYAAKYGIGYLNTGMAMAQARRDFPDATDLEIHTAYLDSMPGTFEQIEENMARFLSE